MLQYLVRFLMSMANLILLQYFLLSFKDVKIKTTKLQVIVMVIQSIVCAGVYQFHNPRISLVVMIAAVIIECLLIDSVMKYRIGMASTYLAIGMIIQYMIRLVHFVFDIRIESNNKLSMYIRMFVFVVLLSAVIVSLCKLFGNRKIRLITLSGNVLNVLVSYSLIEVCICYLIMKNAIVIKSVYCYIISFITLSLLLAVYYLVLILMRKMTALIAKQHEYEKHVAQFAYEQKKVKSERMVKHDIKRKMLEYIYLLENEEYDKLNYILQCQYEELKYLDEEMYSFNPVVNSVLRGCIGKIKGRDIKVETDINIPGDVEFFDGDFGTLLSNLVDNAIEACEKVVPERRYINLIIKVVEENMFIHIENSKISAPVDINVSTKDNPDRHGIGVARVKEIFDKYDGKVKFEQEEDRFVVKGFLNCKNWCQGIA